MLSIFQFIPNWSTCHTVTVGLKVGGMLCPSFCINIENASRTTGAPYSQSAADTNVLTVVTAYMCCNIHCCTWRTFCMSTDNWSICTYTQQWHITYWCVPAFKRHVLWTVNAGRKFLTSNWPPATQCWAMKQLFLPTCWTECRKQLFISHVQTCSRCSLIAPTQLKMPRIDIYTSHTA